LEVVIAALSFLLVLLSCGNAWLWSERSRLTRRLLEASEAIKVARTQSYDCTELLHDLTAGNAVVKITRVNPGEVYLRRT